MDGNDGTGIVDLNTALANVAVSFREFRDHALELAAGFKAESEDPRLYVMRSHKLKLMARAEAEAHDWQRMLDAAEEGVLLSIRSPVAPITTQTEGWKELYAACVSAGRFRLDPHMGVETGDRADGDVRPGTSTSDGQGLGPSRTNPTMSKGKPTIG